MDIAKKLKPSRRGELEISKVNQQYLKKRKLKIELLGRGFTWLDTGTHDSLLEAGQFVQTVEHRQGYKVACLEEIAYKQGYISRKELIKTCNKLSKNNYGKYLLKVAKL